MPARIKAIEEVKAGTWKTERTVWGVKEGLNDLIKIVSDNWLLLLVGQYPNGPLGGLACTLIVSVLGIALALLSPEQLSQTSLRPVQMLAITPSQPLDSIASRHVGSLPLPIRTLLSAIGATERRGAALASYLLFEASYTRSLIELGQIDTLSRRDEVLQFFGVEAELTRSPVSDRAGEVAA